MAGYPADLTWYAAQTKPRQEWLAHRELQRRGYETLHLHYPATVRHARRTIGVLRPYFVRYVFVGVRSDQSLYTVDNTVGVSTIVYAGPRPLEIPAAVIEELRSRGDKDGLIKPPEKEQRQRMEAGQRVKIIQAGPLEGLFATLALDDGRAVRLWLDAFGGKVEAVLDPTGIEPASPAGGSMDPAAVRLRRYRMAGNGAI